MSEGNTAVITDQGAPKSGSEQLKIELEQYRTELAAHCYRMLDAAFEPEDAERETMVRAWRNFERVEGRSALRSWRYRSGTNVCLDMLNGSQRRARPMDLASSQTAETFIGEARPEACLLYTSPSPRD